MVNDTRQPGKCNARVTTPSGLTVIDTSAASPDGEYEPDRDNETTLLSETALSGVRLVSPDGTEYLESPPEYVGIRQWLHDDYKPAALAVDPGAATLLTDELDNTSVLDERPPVDSLGKDEVYTTGKRGEPNVVDDHVWVDVLGAPLRLSYSSTEFDGYCERWPSGGDADFCHAHHIGDTQKQYDQPPSIQHGLYAKRTTYWDALDDEGRRFIEQLVDDWLDDAPFDRSNKGKLNDLYRAAIDQHRAWRGVDEYVTDDGEITGLVTEEPVLDDEGNIVRDDDGSPVTTEREHPANLPLSRLTRDVTKLLEKHGILDTPEQEQAEATKSLAELLASDTDDDS